MGEPLKAVGSNLGPPKGSWLFEQVQFFQSAIFRLLIPNIFSDDFLVTPYGRSEISTGPKNSVTAFLVDSRQSSLC